MPDSPLDPEIQKFSNRIWRASSHGDKLYVHGGGGWELRIGDIIIGGTIGVNGDARWGFYGWSSAVASDDDGCFFELRMVDKRVDGIPIFDRDKVKLYTPLLYRFAILDELADV